MHQKFAHDDLDDSEGFGGFCNQLGIRLLFQYLRRGIGGGSVIGGILEI